MVVRPIITYAATVWCPRVTFKINRSNLSKLQRLTFLGITGAIRADATAATEVLFELPPLHLS
jgi:hypothetical protein